MVFPQLAAQTDFKRNRCSVSVAKGRIAEAIAADHLESVGFRVVARNVRVGALEIDLVIESDAVVAVVEVRYRGPGAYASGLESLASIKKRRMILAADRLFRKHYKNDPAQRPFRIDVCIVHIDDDATSHVEHFPAAITG
jgi:putative endonuclease